MTRAISIGTRTLSVDDFCDQIIFHKDSLGSCVALQTVLFATKRRINHNQLTSAGVNIIVIIFAQRRAC